MKILVVATHPDDEVLGCGGVMARYAAQGEEIHVLVVTRGIPELYSAKFIKQIRAELRAAHAVLGVKEAHFLDFPAPRLDTIPHHELADGIKRVIMRVCPQMIFLPHGGDLHVDHRSVHLATLVAARPMNSCQVEQLLCYETLSETEWAPTVGDNTFIPTVFMNIENHLDQKLQAMTQYRSQLKESPHPRSLDNIRALARFRGGTVGFNAAEAFALVRQMIK